MEWRNTGVGGSERKKQTAGTLGQFWLPVLLPKMIFPNKVYKDITFISFDNAMERIPFCRAFGACDLSGLL